MQRPSSVDDETRPPARNAVPRVVYARLLRCHGFLAIDVKLAITVLSTLIFLIHTQPIHLLAAAAATTTAFDADLRRMQVQMIVAAGAALVVLLVLTALSVYKPRGLTPYGWRKQYRQRAASTPAVGDAASQ